MTIIIVALAYIAVPFHHIIGYTGAQDEVGMGANSVLIINSHSSYNDFINESKYGCIMMTPSYNIRLVCAQCND